MKRSKRRGTKDLPSDELRQALEGALRALQISPRYEFVRLLRAQELLGSKDKGYEAFEALTIEDLIRGGAQKILAIPSLSSARCKLLISILEGLAGEPAHLDSESSRTQLSDEILPPSHALEFLPRREKPLSPKEDLPVMASTEAELKLMDLIRKLKNAPHFEKIKELYLKDFWLPEWPSAPFEQAMTLKQVAELNIESVLKKRSFSGQKVTAFMQALERSITAPFVAGSAADSPDTPSSLSLRASLSNSHEEIWRLKDSPLPGYAKSALRNFEAAGYQPKSPHSLLRIMKRVPHILAAEDFWLLWIQEEHPEHWRDLIESSLLSRSESTLPSARELLLKELLLSCPDIHYHWLSALSAPGITLDALVHAHIDEGCDAALQTVFARVLLSSLGAAHPSYHGVIAKECWTKAFKSFERIMDGALLTLPRPDQEMIEELRALLPFFSLETLTSALHTRARLNPASRIWELTKRS